MELRNFSSLSFSTEGAAYILRAAITLGTGGTHSSWNLTWLLQFHWKLNHGAGEDLLSGSRKDARCCHCVFRNQQSVIGQLPINTKNYKNPNILTFWGRKYLLIMIPALRITVKPTMGDHPFIKLKVITQNRWLLNDGSLTGTGIVVTILSLWLLSICHMALVGPQSADKTKTFTGNESHWHVCFSFYF